MPDQVKNGVQCADALLNRILITARVVGRITGVNKQDKHNSGLKVFLINFYRTFLLKVFIQIIKFKNFNIFQKPTVTAIAVVVK